MFLQGPDVSSIFAAQIIKQPKRMTVKQCNFKVGEVYLFHTDQKHFSKGRHLPEQYRFCRLSTRSELRDYMVNSIYSEIKCLS